jgi:hypothetical protein
MELKSLKYDWLIPVKFEILVFKSDLSSRSRHLNENTRMADQNYEIDIEPGRDADDQEMDVDNDSSTVVRKGRGFGGHTGNVHLSSRNAKWDGPTNPTHATAVRCIPPLFLEHILMVCSY